MVVPSIQPSSRSRCTKVVTHWPWDAGVPAVRSPIVGTFPGCCARTASGHAAVAPADLAALAARGAEQSFNRVSVEGHTSTNDTPYAPVTSAIWIKGGQPIWL